MSMRFLCVLHLFNNWMEFIYAEYKAMSDINPAISHVLRELMRKKGLNSSELARQTLLPQSTIYRIVQGEHTHPHKKTLVALAKFFNVSVDTICGLAPIGELPPISRIPVLDSKQATNWPAIIEEDIEYIVIDKKTVGQAFALRMPDKSMEPLITKNSILIVDPDKEPEYRSLVVVKLNNYEEIVVRQLIKDANNCYIRPLSQDFDHFEMVLLTPQDSIRGTIIEARLNCEML